MSDENKLVTILTPTYNRLKTLRVLYESLENQINFNFNWLVVDDGSTDGTEEWLRSVCENNRKFKITYKRKKNGGKHTALNYAHPFIETELVAVVDSDDTLTKDAIKSISDYWDKYKTYNPSLFIFQRGTVDKSHRQFDLSHVKKYEYMTSLVKLTNEGIKGDHFEIAITKFFLENPFPEFRNENFMGEGWLWQKIGYSGPVVYINKVLYLCKYLEGGLTAEGRKLRIASPNGGKTHAELFMSPKYSMNIRLKNAILYVAYSLILDERFKDIITNSKNKTKSNKMLVLACYIPGLLLKKNWERKYL